ncbi:MAG TPA: helicase-exonuclease AddAB subunit AddA, partial [Bacillota bacterium]|nr:helicase-exonuclease AddAB subunit AddA [Bacillota bacterium]
SAAAGSGKTAVLVARIEHIITGADISEEIQYKPVPIDRMLVVTFTNAAASEMKEKISAALNNAALESPKNLSLIQNQLYALQNANISTFHSFAMEVVRRYFHLTELDPDFKICDEVESTIMKSEAMDRVFETHFTEEEPDFLDFLKDYGDAGNENRIKEELGKLYTGIMAMPDPWGFLEDSVGKLSISKKELKSSCLMKNIWQTVSSKLAKAEDHFYMAAKMIADAGLQKLYDKIKEDISFLLDLREKCDRRDHERFGKAVRAFSTVTLRTCKDEKEEYDLIKDLVKAHREKAKEIIKKEIKEKYFMLDIAVYADDMNKTYGSAKTVRKILLHFHEEYMNIKLEKNLLDFSDIEHYAIRILKDPSASAEYREKFDYIFIDEYQDSNYLHEEIINSIKREDNVFMVGDIKQSIYKFRLAEPEIFKNKYMTYSQRDDSRSTKIDLNMNFRSKGPIIDTVNSIFAPLMEYDEESALYKGVPDHESPEPETEIHIIDSDIPEDHDMDDELTDMKNTELEAVVTARIIRKYVGCEFYDTKKNEIRKLNMKDIVILMRGVKNKAEIFRETLALQGIDAYIDDNSGYFDTLEILTFIDILKVIDNSRQDIPLLGVLRCPIFGFDIEDLIRIRIAKRDVPFYEALSVYSVSGDDSILATKISKVISQFAKWKKEASYMPLDEFVWRLMDETGYYVYAGSLPGGIQRQANLRAFVDRAALFRKKGGIGIYGLLKYTEALKSKSIDISQADIIVESDDIVGIMTIHKSKGLEFPMVIVASLGSRFNSDKAQKKGVSMHKDLGIGLDRVEHEEHWHRKTLIRNIIKDKKKTEELEEETRILYVAFTRAMDRLVLLGCDPCWSKNEEKYETGLKSQTSYLGMIYPFLGDTGIKKVFHERASIGEYISEEEE